MVKGTVATQEVAIAPLPGRDAIGTEAGDTTARRGQRAGLALAVIVAAQLMLILDGTIVNIALPDIQRSLRLSDTNLSWVVNAYALAFGGLLLLGGRVGDVFGRRRTYVAGIVVFTIASLLGGFATSAGWLLAARAGQGVGAAIAAPSGLALLTTIFADGPARTRALGVYSAVQAAGASLGLIAGGMLTEWVSWRWVLFVNVPFGLAIALLTPLAVAESARQPGRFDLAGALTSTLGLVALVYGFIRAAAAGWDDGRALVAFAAAAVLLLLFPLGELRASQPVVPLRLLAQRDRAGAYLGMLLLPGAMLGMFFFLAQFVQEVLGFGPVEAGFAFLPLTLAIFAASQAVPRWLARVDPKTFAVAGATLIVAGMVWLTRISADSGYLSDLLGPMLVLGFGAGFVLVPLSVLILSGVAGRDSGAASGLLQTTQQVGGALGTAILVTVFGTASRAAARDARDGATADARADWIVAEAMTSVFAVAAIVAAGALLVALFVIGSGRSPASSG